MLTAKELLGRAQALEPQLVEWRRTLHRHPEVGFDLTQTKALVKKALTEMGYEPKDCGKAGVIALAGGKKPGKTILLRVMGYSRGDILRAYTKELLLQAVIAVPIGAVLGYLITLFAVGDFATDSIAFKADIHPATYLYAALILIGVLIYVLITAARQLRRQNLVQGLKSREE